MLGPADPLFLVLLASRGAYWAFIAAVEGANFGRHLVSMLESQLEPSHIITPPPSKTRYDLFPYKG